MTHPQAAVTGQFRKRHDCPTSDALLAYARRTLHGLKRQGLRLHLAKCDFCGAELQLLSNHPPVEEAAPRPSAPLPLALLLLAEQSLPRRHVLRKPARRSAA